MIFLHKVPHIWKKIIIGGYVIAYVHSTTAR